MQLERGGGGGKVAGGGGWLELSPTQARATEFNNEIHEILSMGLQLGKKRDHGWHC